MSYTKMHTDEWLYGSARKMKPEIRAIWVDAQAQADLSVIRGTICAAPGVGYSVEQLAAMWNAPKELIEEAFKAFMSEGWIIINTDLTITLIEWLRFQSEYQRVKKYKDTEKNTEKGTTKNTEKGTLNTVSVFISKSSSISSLNSELINIPESILNIWNDYVDMRMRLKRPVTEKAKNLCIGRLVKLSNGDEVIMKKIIEQSIMNSWQGLFPLKEDGHGTGKGFNTGRFVGEFEKGAADKYK